MKYLTLNESATFDVNPYLTKPIDLGFVPSKQLINNFDQSGYSLSKLEIMYHKKNGVLLDESGSGVSSRRYWYHEDPAKLEGAILNHGYLFQRRAYEDEALDELLKWGKSNPVVYKLAKVKPKWGIDFSMDWVDKEGNVCEVFHYEWDSFVLDPVLEAKEKIEALVERTDWDDMGKQVLNKKDEWYHLPFFEQSDWKCRFFGLPPEEFKMVTWN